MPVAGNLKLIARDEEDLAIISAALQDALVQVGNITYLPKRRRFAAVVNRFAWETASPDQAHNKDVKNRSRLFQRVRTGIHFDGVLNVKSHNVARDRQDAVLCLLAIEFDAHDHGSGEVTLVFGGGGAIRLEVECLDVVLDDLGLTWATTKKPQHEVFDE